MDPLIIALVVVVISLIGILLFFISRKETGQSHELKGALDLLKQEMSDLKRLSGEQRQELYQLQTEARKEIAQSLHQMNEQVGRGLSESHRSMQTQFSQTSKLIEDVTQRLTTLDSTNKQVLDFSSQLQKMQDILKNPKQRGILGEFYLESLLGNTLPPESFKMQYAFPDTTIADAVVFVNEKIIPIDSKFTLENYNRCVEAGTDDERSKFEKLFISDLKGRIQETAKYIQPNQGTTDFAFMFIPHEALYYDLLTNKIGSLGGEESENILQRAAGKYRVIIVSPTNFLAYLQTILQALNAMKIEKNAEEIKKRVKELHRHFTAFADFHDRMGKNLSTTVNQFNQSSEELRKLSKDIVKITAGEVGDLIEMQKVTKPEVLE
jgi:DNA recombination protein RmuC